MTSSSLSYSDDNVVVARDNTSRIMTKCAKGMTRHARDGSPLTDSELRDAINSLWNVTPAKAVAAVAAAVVVAMAEVLDFLSHFWREGYLTGQCVLVRIALRNGIPR